MRTSFIRCICIAQPFFLIVVSALNAQTPTASTTKVEPHEVAANRSSDETAIDSILGNHSWHPVDRRPGQDVNIVDRQILPVEAIDDSVEIDPVEQSQVLDLVDRPGQSGANDAFLSRMRPTFSLATEWQFDDELQFSSYETRVKIPTYPVFGPPPPMINAGFTYTNLVTPPQLNLPSDLFQYTWGLFWIRPINEKWMWNILANASLATDNRNTSSDAWRFRGGVFAVYRKNDKWTWQFGAIALGRNDLPVLPAVGAVWQPHPRARIDLTFPRPRIAGLISDDGARQKWGYLSVGLNGTTWGYQRSDFSRDELTYGDWRVVLGWESVPTPELGRPATRGRKVSGEIGYVFARDLEFNGEATTIDLDDTWIVRTSIRF